MLHVARLMSISSDFLFGFELKTAVITGREQILASDVVVVSHSDVLVTKQTVAIYTQSGRLVLSNLFGGHGR